MLFEFSYLSLFIDGVVNLVLVYLKYEFWRLKNFTRVLLFLLTLAPEGLDSLRLLDVDNRVTLPTLSWVRALVRSVDVLHSWALPSLNLKVDAIPGRLNQLNLIICKRGVTYGQCSEICGVNHRFMPIVLESVPLKVWNTWVNSIVFLFSLMNIALKMLKFT